MTLQPTTTALRESFDRCPLLRLRGWTFERALASPLVRKGLELAAKGRARNAARRGEHLPEQPLLI